LAWLRHPQDIAYCPVPVKRYDKVSSVDGRCLSTVAGWQAIREDGELQAVQIQALKDLELRSSTIKVRLIPRLLHAFVQKF
jgi:hypothetical protein